MVWSDIRVEIIKESLQKLLPPILFKALRGVFRFFKRLKDIPAVVLFYFCRIYPLEDKVVATTFEGKKYGDNPQYILEQIHRREPGIQIVWLCDKDYNIKLPDYIERADYRNSFSKAYELSTAKVWIDTHRLKTFVRKRKGQLFIETWHGGLGLKKLDADSPKFNQMYTLMREVSNTSKLADLFISNSRHLTNIYRSAFQYTGKIWKSGYPKNDILFEDKEKYRQEVRNYYDLPSDIKIMVYAPTFRDNFRKDGVDMGVYEIDFEKVHDALEAKFGGKWEIIVRFHPFLVNLIKLENQQKCVLDGTTFPEIQHLIMASDAFISDYSSCLFDAAILEMPCFTFATDFEEYKNDRGVYYTMDELPFPYAKNNEQLLKNICEFDSDAYHEKWQAFQRRTGLYETGHAAKDIAEVVIDFIKGNTKPLENVKNDF